MAIRSFENGAVAYWAEHVTVPGPVDIQGGKQLCTRALLSQQGEPAVQVPADRRATCSKGQTPDARRSPSLANVGEETNDNTERQLEIFTNWQTLI
jgi:hypothetical protein